MSHLNPKPFFSILAATLLAGVGSLAASEYYMSPAGNDTAAGSISAPWKTFAHAVPLLVAGDTLTLRGGSYPERLILNARSGTSEAPITIHNYPDETAIIDGSTLVVPAGGRAGLVVLQNCSHLQLHGLEIAHYVTSSAACTPAGIQIEGAGTGVKISHCVVHHIYQNSTNQSANGFGICVYGTSATAIDALQIDSNEIHDLRTGQSESLVLNGNVVNFAVSGNHVHHCNNIGIDFIGYENSAPAAVDRARNGICQGNYVHDIDSAFNPGYGGDFTTAGGERSAAGIYIDGGINITVAGNRVHNANFGIELASENSAGATEDILLLDNLLHHNTGPGIIMGGYDSQRGKTRRCQVSNNTLFRNDSLKTYGGQMALQFYLENNTVKNNIIWAEASTGQMIVHYVEGGTSAQRAFPAGNVFDYNLYFHEGPAAAIEFGLNPTGKGADQGNRSYTGLAAWRTAVGGELHSIFANPGFTISIPSILSTAADFRLSAASAAINLGEPSPPFIAAVGEKDYFGASRIAGGRVDMGFHEWMTPLQSWRDQYFESPDGGPNAGDFDDPDHDTMVNLLEYSQGMNPTKSDLELAPYAQNRGTELGFHFRKNAPELLYSIHTSKDLQIWQTSTAATQSDGATQFWQDFPFLPHSQFFRLEVSH